jgi:hypothetical protein
MTRIDELQKSPAIARYLRDLGAGLSRLPVEERNAIVADVTDHISAEVDALPHDADVHSVDLILERLGSPSAIAAEASGTDPAPLKGFARFRMSRTYAALTILLLALGSILVPVLGWIAGIVFLWMSDVWRLRDKVVGTLVWPGGLGWIYFLAFLAPVSMSATSCSSSSATGAAEDCTTLTSGPPEWFGPTVVAVIVFVQIIVWIALYRVFSRRLAAQSPKGSPS